MRRGFHLASVHQVRSNHPIPTLLTPEQRNDLQQHGDKPMPVIDPVTHKVYVLMAGDVFERFKALFDDEPVDIREADAAQSAAAGAAGWHGLRLCEGRGLITDCCFCTAQSGSHGFW